MSGLSPSYCDHISFEDLVDDKLTSSSSLYSVLNKNVSPSQNHLERVMKSTNSYTWEDYGRDILNTAMPWIAFACLAFLILILAILIRCIKSLCFVRKIKERGDFFRNLAVVFSFLVTFLALGCCGFIIHYVDAAFQSYMQLQCAAGRIPYQLLNGNPNKQWQGLSTTRQLVTNLSEMVGNQFAPETQQLWANTDWLTNANNDFSSNLYEFYNTYSNVTVMSPNPMNSTDVPLKYTTNLGPPGNGKSFTGEIENEYMSKVYQILGTMEQLKVGSLIASEDVKEVVGGLNSAVGEIDEFIKGSNKVKSDLDSWLVDNHSTVKAYWRGFTIGIVVWGWFICLGVLITVSAQALNKPKLANFLCCYWLAAGISAVLGFVLTVFVLSAGILSDDSCGLMGQLLTSQGLATYTLIIPEYYYKYINTCLNENGDINNILQIAANLSAINSIYNAAQGLQTMNITPGLADFQSIAANQQQINLLSTYKDIYASGVAENSTADFNLNQLNLYTNSEENLSYQDYCVGNYTVDMWSYQNCPAEYILVDPIFPTQNLGNKSCLVVGNWTGEQVSQRYAEFLDCNHSTAVGDYVQTIGAYQSAIRGFITEISNVGAEMTDGLAQVNRTITQNVNNAVVQNGKIQGYIAPDAMGQIIVEENSLLAGINCSFARPLAVTLKKSFCNNSKESMYQVFVYLFILSFLMILLEFVNLYLSRALLKREAYEEN
jgi:hypothetical protein